MEASKSLTPYRSTRSRANSTSSENPVSPTTSLKGRITRGKSQDIEKHVSTPMPRKIKRSQSLKNVTVSLIKLKSKMSSVEASAEENVVLEEEEIFDDKLQSTEVVQNGSKENKNSSNNVPDHLNDEQMKSEQSILKVVDQANGAVNSKNSDTQQSIANSNLPDVVDSLKSKSVELIESIPVQDEPAAVAVPITRATKWRQTLGGTIDLSSENETGVADESELAYTPTEGGTPQMILEKFTSTANNDVNELPTVDSSESSAAQLNNQCSSLSSNQNDIPIQSGAKSPIIDTIEKKSNGRNTTSTDTEFSKDSGDAIHRKSDGKPIDDNLGITALVTSIGHNDEVEQSVEDDEIDSSVMFSDDGTEKEIQKDSMDVTALEDNQISAADVSSGNDVLEVEDSEISFTASESSIDFLAGDDSNVNQKTEYKPRSKRPNTSEEDVSNELKILETKPKQILKSRRLSGVMAVSKEVKKRMSLHPNLKLNSGELKTSNGVEEGLNIMASNESFESIQHGNKTEGEFRGRNRSHGNRIYDTSDEEVLKDVEKIPVIKSSKRHSDEMPVSKEVNKRMSLHPNVKLSSGQMKKHDVSDDAQISKVENVGDSTERQSTQHNEIGNAGEDNASKELENMSAKPENIKKISKRLSDSATMKGHKSDFKRMSLHPSTLLKSTTASLANSSLAECDPKEFHDDSKASSMNSSESNDNTEAMETDQFVNSAETFNKHTSSDSTDETSQQLKQKKAQKLTARKENEQQKQTVLTALRRKEDKKSKEIPKADTNAIEKALVHRNFLLSKHATESKIIATKVSKRHLKRKVDAPPSEEEDNLSIKEPKMKKQKILQILESSTPKIKNKTMKRYPTQQLAVKLNPKKKLKVGTKKNLSKMQWTTAGPFMVTQIPTNKDFDVLLSTSEFTVTSLSGSNFSFSSFKDSSTIHVQSSV